MDRESEKVNVRNSIPSKRGRKELYTVDELKQIALKVKKELKGAKLTSLGLEKHTKIGRNTWSRKIPEFIEQLNNRMTTTNTLNNEDDVYYPNFTALLDLYEDDKVRLKNEMVQFEIQFQKNDLLITQLKTEIGQLEQYRIKYELLKEENKKLDLQAKHYKSLYDKIIVSSTFEHLRAQTGIKNNLIYFDNTEKNVTLSNLESFFPDDQNHSIDTSLQRSIENRKALENLIPGIINKNE